MMSTLVMTMLREEDEENDKYNSAGSKVPKWQCATRGASAGGEDDQETDEG